MDDHNKMSTPHSVRDANEKIIVKDRLTNEHFVISYDEIFAFLSYGNYVKVKTEKKVLLSYNSMKLAEARFCKSNRFIRISRSAIIAKNKIVSLNTNEVTLSNGKKYPIGRNFSKAFFDKLKKKYF